MKELRDKYKQWCEETKRNGSVLVGGSVYEFFDWLESTPPPAPIKTEGEDERTEYYNQLTKNLGKTQPYHYTGPKCVPQCENFPHYETKHHKDCPFYKNSLSEKYDKIAPPSPVGIDVDALRKLFDNNFDCYTSYTKFDNSTVDDVPVMTKKKFIEVLAGYAASLPQSNNEFDELKSFLSKKANELNIYVDFSDKTYDGDKSAPMDLFGFIEHIFNQTPQSSIEEEKELWEEVSKIVIKHYTSYNYTDQDSNELQSKFKIYKR